MQPVPSAPVTQNTVNSQQGSAGILFQWLLLAVVCLALVPMLILARSEFISYDGYWHLFIATQNRWDLFMSEYLSNAHPILFFLLLRWVARISQSHLALRFISVTSGAGSIWLLGQIGFKIYKNKVIALALALAYGLSMTMMQIEIDVRSYSLCLLFILLAFNFLLRFLSETSNSARDWLLFGVFTSAAIATEYFAIFFFAACTAALALSAIPVGSTRRKLIHWAGQHPLIAPVPFILPGVTTMFFYYTHISLQPTAYGHLSSFYWTTGTPVANYLLQNLLSDLNYLSPVQIPSGEALASLLVWGFPLAIVLPFLGADRSRSVSQSLPGLTATFTLIVLAAVGLMDRYPFGGFERQQSVAFPFLMIVGFLFLDRLLSTIPVPALGPAVLVLSALATAFHFHKAWNELPRRSSEILSDEFNKLQAKASPAEPVYVDQFSIIGYYIHTHDWRWRFMRHLYVPDRIDEYQLTDQAGRQFPLLRNLLLWNFNLHDPAMYQALARSLNGAQLPAAELVLMKQIPGPADPSQILTEEAEVKKLAAGAGLTVGQMYDDNNEALIQFSRVH